MSNPPKAIDALLTMTAITLGQAALLEKIGSPLLATPENRCAADVIPSLYLLALPSAEGIKHLPTLAVDAFSWADTLSPGEFIALQQRAIDAIAAFYAMMPPPENDETKKASPATVG